MQLRPYTTKIQGYRPETSVIFPLRGTGIFLVLFLQINVGNHFLSQPSLSMQNCKASKNLQTWFGGRLWPKNEEDFVDIAPKPLRLIFNIIPRPTKLNSIAGNRNYGQVVQQNRNFPTKRYLSCIEGAAAP